MMYRGNSDVGVWCRSKDCEKANACQDPLACTQLADIIIRGLSKPQGRPRQSPSPEHNAGEGT
jgi:hypothetical protein